MAGRHSYSHEQLEQYFDRICLPKSKRVYNVAELPDDNARLDFLNLVQKHQLVKVPWENLTQHYSWHRVVNVKPNHLFNKIVHSPGRGGYCMEANFFYHTVLFSLGFNVYMAGSRIHHEHGTYGGWTHVVNIVTIAGTKYLLDGGFGPQGPSRPFALNPGVAETQVAPAQMRVLHEPIVQNLDQSQKVWIYQHRNNEDMEWHSYYCFTDMEFIPADIESMNFAPWLNQQSFFTHFVVAVRFTTSRESDDAPGSPGEEAMEGEIDGSLSLGGSVLKWRRRGEKVLQLEFKKDEERVEALEKYFGLVVAEEDREAIKGTAAEVAAAHEDD